MRAKRLFAVSAAGLLMAGGAALGTAGTASAAAPAQHVAYVAGGWDDDDDHGGWDHDDDYGYGGYSDDC
ncbi:hypothetical protein OOK31_05595 [Streptomyces sp. NBC_00249]|uniref:hypothetical protein n=1 Tax=Streptomyces sp. NBC_00249 TaxID=2975690 RepID=UPI00224EA5D5|nr:hypothetical protein [Streptomyces sp. NBC_00249]MCX5193366.1 hypothetical protein [Streptomyces sp. NBC_00249]